MRQGETMAPDDGGVPPIEEYKGAWRVEVAGRLRDLEARLDAVGERGARRDGGPVELARRALADARAAIANGGVAHRVYAWWTGSAITAAWEAAQTAEAELVHLESTERVRASLPALLEWIRLVMANGPHREHYERLLEAYIADPEALDRDVVRQAHRDVIAANTNRYGNVHVFRRLLALVIALLVLGVVGLSVVDAIDPDVVPIDVDADSGDSLDLAAVAVVGAVGGLLAIAFGLGENQAPSARYDPRAWQAGLKAVAGAATAIIGVLIVESDLIVAPANDDTPALLAYAAVFGFSQQAFTRFVDKRAAGLVAPEDGKKSDGDS